MHRRCREKLCFTELTTDAKIAKHTGFPIGTELYYLQRLHYLDGKALLLNHNYFLKKAVPGLTPEIAANSIYEYIENPPHMTIVNSKRVMTVEKITQIDEKYLHLKISPLLLTKVIIDRMLH